MLCIGVPKLGRKGYDSLVISWNKLLLSSEMVWSNIAVECTSDDAVDPSIDYQVGGCGGIADSCSGKQLTF